MNISFTQDTTRKGVVLFAKNLSSFKMANPLTNRSRDSNRTVRVNIVLCLLRGWIGALRRARVPLWFAKSVISIFSFFRPKFGLKQQLLRWKTLLAATSALAHNFVPLLCTMQVSEFINDIFVARCKDTVERLRKEDSVEFENYVVSNYKGMAVKH